MRNFSEGRMRYSWRHAGPIPNICFKNNLCAILYHLNQGLDQTPAKKTRLQLKLKSIKSEASGARVYIPGGFNACGCEHLALYVHWACEPDPGIMAIKGVRPGGERRPGAERSLPSLRRHFASAGHQVQGQVHAGSVTSFTL